MQSAALPTAASPSSTVPVPVPVLHIVVAVPDAPSAALPWLLVAAAVLWVGPLGASGRRLGSWYGRLRVDGHPG